MRCTTDVLDDVSGADDENDEEGAGDGQANVSTQTTFRYRSRRLVDCDG